MIAALADLVGAIQPVDDEAVTAARARHAELAKPPGSLGELENVGARLAGIAGRVPPPIPRRPALVIAAGDHGVHAQGVTPWPQAITALMVEAFCEAGAAANVLARTVGSQVAVLDVGVSAELDPHPALRSAKVRRGTRDLSIEDAMTHDECVAAVEAGHRLAMELVEEGADLLLTGDMGIANTTASAALIAAFTGESPAAVTGRGTGIDDAMLAHKTAVVERALVRHGDRSEAVEVLSSLGGLEHAALVGVILAGATARVPVVLDGVIADAAALAAIRICPLSSGYLIAGHRSAEPGASIALAHLGLVPLIDLGLRLGEGTGALLAVPSVQAAAAVLAEMATLTDLGVTEPA